MIIKPDEIQHIVSHCNSPTKGCPDGIASALILKDAFPEASLEFVCYNSVKHREMKVRPGMIFVDMTPHRDLVQQFVKAGAYVLDHHKHAKDIVDAFGKRGMFADENEQPGVSGALLAFQVWERSKTYTDLRKDTLWKLELSKMAYLAGIRDTWQKRSEDWAEACAQAETLLFFEDQLFDQEPPWPTRQQMLIGHKLMSERRWEANELAASFSIRIHKAGDTFFKFGFFNDLDTSDVGEAARTQGLDIDFICGFGYRTDCERGPLKLIFSLRSVRDGFDVGAIAKANGGGGHTAAAGFTIADSRLLVDESPIAVFSLALRKWLQEPIL